MVAAELSEAVLWQNGQLTGIGYLPGSDYSMAWGVNNNGEVCGWSSLNGISAGFVWSNGLMTQLGTSTAAEALNDSGKVVGGTAGGLAYVWQNGVTTMLGDLPGGPVSSATADINRNGQIVGLSSSKYGHEAFLWQNGTMVGLGDLPGGGFQSWANAINNLGQVVGCGQANGGNQAFLWQKGKMTGLGSIMRYTYSEAKDINDSGVVVGHAGHPVESTEAFVWTKAAGMVSLNTLLDGSGNGWFLIGANAINASGQIVGGGKNPLGQPEGFILTPLP